MLRRRGNAVALFDKGRTKTYIARSGVQRALETLSNVGDQEYAVTGSFAAARLKAVTAPVGLAVYTPEPDALAATLNLLPAEQGADVHLVRPADEGVYERVSTSDRIRWVAPSQVVLDCLGGHRAHATRGRGGPRVDDRERRSVADYLERVLVTGPPRLMVEARRVLLEALEALTDHHGSLVLVGAQAVYLRTDEVALSFSASYTTDADLAIDPTTLARTPLLAELMTAAGFERTQPDRPGIWGKSIVLDGHDEIIPVDLIVPEALAGPGRRGARLAGHGKQAAGRADGLEAALVDRSPMTIRSLDPTDKRTINVDVAGPTALLVAKLHKIGERTEQAEARPDRVIAKDAADCYRLMLHLGAERAFERFESLLEDPIAGNATRTALRYLKALFGVPAAPGVRLAVEGLSSDVPADRVEGVCVGFTRSVLGRFVDDVEL